MRFVAIDQAAAEEVASDRFLQSVEFEPGGSLARWLGGQEDHVVLNSRLIAMVEDGGSYILRDGEETDNIFVIDEISSKIFSNRTDAEYLMIFQKLCRFAIRYWKKLRPNQNERYIANSTKAVVFPLPISNQTSFRVVIEREPDQKRRLRRSTGAYLLAYRAGTGEGEGPAEEAPVTEFRKALIGLKAIRAKRLSTPDATPASQIPSLAVTTLDGLLPGHVAPQQGFERWQSLATEKQKEFIQLPLSAPHRIEGAAGTGKTLSLILKSIQTVRDAHKNNIEHRSLFIAHSESTRKTIQDLFDANDQDGFSHKDKYASKQSIQVTTLHRLCTDLLNTEISESEFLDTDAMESKNTQLLYVAEAVTEVIEQSFNTYKNFMSEEFRKFVENEDQWSISEMVQLEISVIIKGRADEDLEKYRRLPHLNYGLPLKNAGDRGFVFLMFQRYQEKLRESAQFDTDDIVLTTTGQLNTPIWRRRRRREGYDSIFIDETHLFNMNELSVFHYLTRDELTFPIAYSVDRAQSLGDRGWNDAVLDGLFNPAKDSSSTRTVVHSVFRCSPEIVNLAFAVTSSGATLFTNFEDPLRLASSAFTEADEQMSSTPTYHSFPNDNEMVVGAFQHAERVLRDLGKSRHHILIVAFDPIVFDSLVKFSSDNNKPVEIIHQRGDIDVVRRAQRSGRFVVGMADFVGGLEFDAVVLVGVDNGRVPPTRSNPTPESLNFLSYASHGRLYVAITRAKFRVEILGSEERGPSRLLEPAFVNGALLRANDTDVSRHH